jgi:hypothetical protein
MEHVERKANKEIGVGGYKCVCCGPEYSGRDKHRRRVRRRMKADIHKEVEEYYINKDE